MAIAMALLDHFRPPLSNERHWESFHTTWATAIADALNDRWLPEGYFAEEQLHPSARVEIDVATFEEQRSAAQDAGGVQTSAQKTWAPPAPQWTVPGLLIEGIELLIYSREGGPTLVGAIELVSPGNKDRPAARRAFAAKCAGYLHQGIGLLIVDVVTSRSGNLHDEIMTLLDRAADCDLGVDLYAAAYRPLRRDGDDEIEVWPAELAVGRSLPTLPLWLGPSLVVPVDLDGAYASACRRRRIPLNQ
jgi:hypothetical protein